MNVLTVMTLAYSIIDKETNRELHRVVLQNMPKHTFSHFQPSALPAQLFVVH